ncbi:MAG: endonuclease, partial [Bacteroidales bacterium]|nr:endonuclease [Bacteroidales bacterium]
MKTRNILLFTVGLLLSVSIQAVAQPLELNRLSEEECIQWQKRSEEQAQKKKSKPFSAFANLPSTITIDKTLAVGEIPFTSDVSASGAMTCNVPIEVYPGINGMQPQLALAYNHWAGKSVVGIGWNIAGLSSISRTPKNKYYDGVSKGIELTKDAAFTLDGVRLIELSETANQIKYETQQGNIKVNAFISGSLVKYFEVLYPNGNKGIYGFTSNTSHKLFYPLTKMTDLFDNSVTYSYTEVDNHYRIMSISYNGDAKVEFAYKLREDAISTYEVGWNVREDRLLDKITCKFGSSILRTYQLEYETNSPNAYMYWGARLSELKCTVLNAKLNPLSFYYGENSAAYQYHKSETQLATSYRFSRPEQLRVAKGKFNIVSENDGMIEWPNQNPYWQHYRNSNLFQHSQDRFDNYYTGDEDILLYPELSDGIAFSKEFKTEAGFIDIFCANIDGKGGDEVIKVNNVVSGNYDQVTFKVYTGNSYYIIALKNTRTYSFSTVLTDHDNGKSIHPKFYYTGDFNGDGKTEVLAVSCHNPLGKTQASKCYLFDLDTGTKLHEGHVFPFAVSFVGTQTDAETAEANTDRLLVIDYDGDGKSDICHIHSAGTDIYTYTSTGFSKVATTYTGLKRGDLPKRSLLAGELNSDGKTDLLLSPPTTDDGDHMWSIFHSRGDGLFAKIIWKSTNNYSDARFFMQDVNGDGLTGLIKTNSNLFLTHLANNGIVPFSSDHDEYTPRGESGIPIPVNINNPNYYCRLAFLKKDGKMEFFTYPRNDTHERLFTGVVSSTGTVHKFDYQMLAEYANYEKGYNASFPYENYYGPLHVPIISEHSLNG